MTLHFGEVELRRTKSKAPSIVCMKHLESGIPCDISIRSGAGGDAAGVLKAELLREINSTYPMFGPLAVMVKSWAYQRGVNNPRAGLLNSFTWAIMAAFYIQTEPPLSHKTLVQTLKGFFAYWSAFRFESAGISLRHMQVIHSSEFHVEDPVEPDENCARTLAAIRLPELQAELCRAHHLLVNDEREWTCVTAIAKDPKSKMLELQPFLPVMQLSQATPTVRQQLGELLRDLPAEAVERLQIFVTAREAVDGSGTLDSNSRGDVEASNKCGKTREKGKAEAEEKVEAEGKAEGKAKVEGKAKAKAKFRKQIPRREVCEFENLPPTHRRLLHQATAMLGLQSESVGKKSKRKLIVTKPGGWQLMAAEASVSRLYLEQIHEAVEEAALLSPSGAEAESASASASASAPAPA
jgi:hypothetical protein